MSVSEPSRASGPVSAPESALPSQAGPSPDRLGGERAMLDGWLDYYRVGLLRKCAGLTAEQFAVRSCDPSRLSLAGPVRHMTEIERAYVHRLAAGPVTRRRLAPGGKMGPRPRVAEVDGEPDREAQPVAYATSHRL